MISRELLWEMWAHDAFGAGGFRETIKKTLLACGFNDDAVCAQLKDIIDCGLCFAHYFDENSNGKEENRISSFLSSLEIMFAFKSASSENLEEKDEGIFESALFSLTEADQLLLWKHHIVFAKLAISVDDILKALKVTTEIKVLETIFADFQTELLTIQATLNAYETFSREVPRKKLPADANVKRYLAAKDSLRDSILEGILKQSGSKEGLNNENDRTD